MCVWCPCVCVFVCLSVRVRYLFTPHVCRARGDQERPERGHVPVVPISRGACTSGLAAAGAARHVRDEEHCPGEAVQPRVLVPQCLAVGVLGLGWRSPAQQPGGLKINWIMHM